jgi:carboxylate-amine ligase
MTTKSIRPIAESISAESLTFGIEEELFLVELRTGRAPRRVPKAFIKTCQRRLGPTVKFEMMQSQVELVSPIFSDSQVALKTMVELRAQVTQIAQSMQFGVIACGSHPLARWQQQAPTEKPRYRRIAEEYQIIGARDLLCGLHVHVAIPIGDRVQVMNRLMPWLPLFLALSTSSPFWNLQRTGLFAYRQSAYAEWPRAGIPDFFDDEADYDRFVAVLQRTGSIEDGGELWWAIRPSPRFPTIELRIADSCTRVQDTIALATLFRCLVSAHLRLPQLGATRTTATRRLIEENRWRAERYGIEAEFVDESGNKTVSVAELVDRAFDLIAPDARILDPHNVLRTIRTILARGTSAHEQLHIYEAARVEGESHHDALQAVVRWLIETTTPTQS